MQPRLESSDDVQAGQLVSRSAAQGVVTETVQLEVLVRDARQVAAFESAIVFDTAVARLVSVEAGEVLPDGSELLLPKARLEGVAVLGSYIASGAVADGNGVLAVLNFEIAEDADPGFQLVPQKTGLFGSYGQRAGGRITLSTGGGELPSMYLPYLARESGK
jgi:hypothetical protein